MSDTGLDREAVLAKYAAERAKRLRSDGTDQYVRPAGEFARYLDDPHTPRIERAPLSEHRTVVCIGGGLAGLAAGARLKEAGATSVRIIDKGGDFGGTWYWNRYPGAQCDTASYVYMPLLEETGHMPTEKYAHGPEILRHCQRIGKHFGLYADALFHTEVTELTWDEARSRWVIATNRGGRLSADFVWACGELYVFQRTPSSVDARRNQPTDPDWFASIATPGWQDRWLENFAANQSGGSADVDLVMDGWTDIARRARARVMALPAAERDPAALAAALQDCDLEKMAEIRARVDAIVSDRSTADRLKAWYGQLCKRPCFHDEYLQSFNLPGVHLVDTDGKGVSAITPDGVVVAGREYPLDCLIFASGFEVGTSYTRRAGYEVTGRSGVRLSERWADGMRSLHGVHVHGFPNMFLVQPTQGANLISNVPHNLADTAKTIAVTVRHAVEGRFRSVEVTSDAEEAWVRLLLSGPSSHLGGTDCTPGYYNNEGRDGGLADKLRTGYPAGAQAYFAYISKWRESGTFEGLEFR